EKKTRSAREEAREDHETGLAGQEDHQPVEAWLKNPVLERVEAQDPARAAMQDHVSEAAPT
ncbi:hypothetical protein M9458_027999, partial [Cirrhinus mrigala]